MSEIIYKAGDATAPEGTGNKIIVHICNDRGGWGRGFVGALSRRWSAPEAAYRQWYVGRKANDFALSAVQMVQVEPELWVANLIGQHGYRTVNGVPPIRYEAVATGLETVAEFAKENNASIHMPRIGCGLAGGNWEQIAPIIEEKFVKRGVAVTVYDLG